MNIEQVDRESRERDAQMESLVNNLLMRISALEQSGRPGNGQLGRLVNRIDAVERWCRQHEAMGHG
jgi:hypothetical protein